MKLLKKIFLLFSIIIKLGFLQLISVFKFIKSYFIFIYYQKNLNNLFIFKKLFKWYNLYISFNLFLFLKSKYLFLKTQIINLSFFIKTLNLNKLILIFKHLYLKLYNFQKNNQNFKLFLNEKKISLNNNIILYYYFYFIYKILFNIMHNRVLMNYIKKIWIYLRFYRIFGKYYYLNQISYNYTNLQFYSNYNYSFFRFFYTWLIDLIEIVFSKYYYNQIKNKFIHIFNHNQFFLIIFFKKLWFIMMFLIFYIYMLLNIVFNYNLFIKNPVDSSMAKYRDTENKYSWIILALFKPIQYFIRPFFRYLPTYRMVILNFFILNKLFIRFIFIDILNLFKFSFNVLLKMLFFIYYGFIKLFQLIKNIYYYFGLILIFDGIFWAYKQTLILIFTSYFKIFYFLFQIFKLNISNISYIKFIKYLNFSLTFKNYLFIFYNLYFNMQTIRFIFGFILKSFVLFFLFIIYNFILLFLIFIFFKEFLMLFKFICFILFFYNLIKYFIIISLLSQLYFFSSFFIFYNQRNIYFCIKNNLYNCLNQLVKENKFSKIVYNYYILNFDFKMESINVKYLEPIDFDDDIKLSMRYKNLNFLENLNKNDLINNKFTLSNKLRKLNILFLIDLFSLVFYFFTTDKIFFKYSNNFMFYYKKLYNLYYVNYIKLTSNRCNKYFKFNTNYSELDNLFLNYNSVNYMKLLKLLLGNKFDYNYIYLIFFFNNLLKKKENYFFNSKKKDIFKN